MNKITFATLVGVKNSMTGVDLKVVVFSACRHDITQLHLFLPFSLHSYRPPTGFQLEVQSCYRGSFKSRASFHKMPVLKSDLNERLQLYSAMFLKWLWIELPEGPIISQGMVRAMRDSFLALDDPAATDLRWRILKI